MFRLLLSRNIFDLPTSVSLGYLWCGGFVLGGLLVLQIVSGVVLSFVYVCDSFRSFRCVLDISNDGFGGWVVRYLHVWGVTLIFIFLFFHIGRSLYYSSYAKGGVWNVGFVLYLAMMVEAFLGYILPWHQMSYWAATVLASILDVVPLVGSYFFKYAVGGFSVSGVTLVRVFSLHVCLAFLILGLSVFHLWYLHAVGSNNPLFALGGYGDFVYFHSFYSVKDGFVMSLVCVFLVVFMWLFPDFSLDTESFIEADFLVTPVSIKPEWYFLGYYAMLRSVDSKLGGLVLVVLFLFVLWLPSFNVSCVYSLVRQVVFWLFVWFVLFLSFLGSQHPEFPFIFYSKCVSFFVVFFLSVFKLCWVDYFVYSRVKWVLGGVG